MCKIIYDAIKINGTPIKRQSKQQKVETLTVWHAQSVLHRQVCRSYSDRLQRVQVKTAWKICQFFSERAFRRRWLKTERIHEMPSCCSSILSLLTISHSICCSYINGTSVLFKPGKTLVWSTTISLQLIKQKYFWQSNAENKGHKIINLKKRTQGVFFFLGWQSTKKIWWNCCCRGSNDWKQKTDFVCFLSVSLQQKSREWDERLNSTEDEM